MFATIALLAALAAAPQQAPAQAPEHATPTAEALAAVEGEAPQHEESEFDLIEHIADARHFETPFGEVVLPAAHSWQVGPVDLTPTKHVVFLLLTGLVVLAILLPAAAAAGRSGPGSTPKKGHNVIETLVLFVRDQMVMPNIGHGGERYAPFIITLFFFILIANLFGILPWGASVTGNISVTAALAILTFLVVEVTGMISLGPRGYLGTIVYIPQGLPGWMVPIMVVIMTPVELLGKLTKPFALAIRLFANMVAGHVVLLAIIGLIFLFGSFAIAVGPVVMAVALTFLEIFVAFLQAYIFALLSAVFIGLIRHAH
jgi:F-type H+-transporting ATPase subunit a